MKTLIIVLVLVNIIILLIGCSNKPDVIGHDFHSKDATYSKTNK